MREFRLEKNDTARYSSFGELREAFGLKAISKHTSDEKKLADQRNKFVKTCRCCGQPLTYISGTNTLACKNTECKGIKKTSKNPDGTEKVWYVPVTRTLDEKGFEIALNLFAD
jgi:hypothetical protein